MSKSKIAKIRIERQYGYYSDVNGVLKGEWGGYEKLNEKGPNGESLYQIYYNRFSRRIIINEFGYFYNMFSCQKYDAVLLLTPNFFICEKNNRLGIIDKDGKDVLNVVYNDISLHEPFSDKLQLLTVTTETGKFLFNLLSGKKSDVYDNIILNYDEALYGIYNLNGVIYQMGEKYGLMNLDGEILLHPIYFYNKFERRLILDFQGSRFPISVRNGLLYDKIPANKYDLCFKVGHEIMAEFYITQTKSKYGLLNWKGECVSEPQYDDIILYKEKYGVKVCRTAYSGPNGSVNTLFVICKKNRKFSLYNLQDGKCIISGCEKMEYKKGWYGLYIKYEKHRNLGYVTVAGIIVSKEEYESITTTSYNFIVSKGGKFGALNGEGLEIAPCKYDAIECNDYGELVAKTKEKDIILNPIPKDIDDSYYDEYEYERPTYDRYSGSFAQDEMGWSDDDIDTVLDGDPDAYWNID